MLIGIVAADYGNSRSTVSTEFLFRVWIFWSDYSEVPVPDTVFGGSDPGFFRVKSECVSWIFFLRDLDPDSVNLNLKFT